MVGRFGWLVAFVACGGAGKDGDGVADADGDADTDADTTGLRTLTEK